nr:FAD:protein FMN transferase [Nitrospirota bacterium]
MCQRSSHTGATTSGLAAVLLLAVSSLSACQSVPPPAPVMVQRAQMLMGTLVQITAVAPSEAQAQTATTAGFQEIRRLEDLLSTWIPTSELSRVNEAAGREPVAVSPDTLLILQRSLDMARLTEGGFNIVVGPAVQAWSVTEQQRVPTDTELEALRPLVDLAQLRLDAKAGTVLLARTGMRVDVGGIGKGFAADRAVAVMQRVGATAGVVALSGDIKTFGRLPDGRPFPFGIRHPRKEGALLARLDLQDEAISTAGDYERFFEREGIRYHHILDPKTLKQARGCQSVTIVATEGTLADGLDTGIFVMGPDAGMALIERLPGVEGVIVDSEGRVLVSSGLKNRLKLEPNQP